MKNAACGKFILGGEHSIVFKGCGLAFPLKNQEVVVTEDSNLNGLIINQKKCSDAEWENVSKLRIILGAQHQVSGMRVESTLPIGAGLGWSAAFCAAIARMHQNLDPEALAQAALKGEKFFHGSPSGIDPYAVSLAEPIVFWSKDLKYKLLNVASFVEEKLCFVLADSGLRHSTLKVIEGVQKLKKELPLVWDDLISALADNAQNMWKSFEQSPQKLGSLMNDSHFRLIQLGVSCNELDDIVEKLRSQGALGAKLTGAGKGGFVLGLFKKSRAEELKLPIVFG